MGNVHKHLESAQQIFYYFHFFHKCHFFFALFMSFAYQFFLFNIKQKDAFQFF